MDDLQKQELLKAVKLLRADLATVNFFILNSLNTSKSVADKLKELEEKLND